MSSVLENIYFWATGTQDPAQVTLGRELGRISDAAVIDLPALCHIRRNIQLQEQAYLQLPNPADRKDVPELRLEYQQSCNNEQFVITFLGQGDADRIFIFGTNQSLQLWQWKTGSLMKFLRFVWRYFFRYTLIMYKLTVFMLCSQTKQKGFILDYSEKYNSM